MMARIRLRDAVEEDLQHIYEIEKTVYPRPWTFNFFRIIFHINKDLFIVAVDDHTIIGYTVGEIESMDADNKVGHILNIAVKKEYQGKGVGSMLLSEIERRFKERELGSSYLEVRKSNQRARSLYVKRGYEYVRTAENYYGDENGIIMAKKLTL